MNRNAWACLGLVAACGLPARADSYDTLLHRYEKQIQQQERELRTLKVRLNEKEKDAVRWQQKSTEAKSLWSQASEAANRAKDKMQNVMNQWSKTKTLAEAAEWTATEHRLLASASDTQLSAVTRELMARRQAPPLGSAADWTSSFYPILCEQLAELSLTAHSRETEASGQETALRTEEMRWQSEERQRSKQLEALHVQQQAQWLRWQEADRKRQALEDEKMQMEQSEQALHVMLAEIRDHRNHTLAFRRGKADDIPALASIKGTLPWPIDGKVTQNFGRQYSTDLNQLLVSNGIKIESAQGRTVRSIQPGKVLFASPFRQYGRLVIIQHKNNLTSVYGGLGDVVVKEGDQLAALDAVGSIGTTNSFYFELRCDEQPINPMTYLTPYHPSSEISSRRTY